MSKRTFGRGIGLAAAIAVAGAVVTPVTASAADASTATAKASTDFNGDGYADVAVAAPGAKVNGHARAGYVAVVYGSAKGAAPRTSRSSARTPPASRAPPRPTTATATASPRVT